MEQKNLKDALETKPEAPKAENAKPDLRAAVLEVLAGKGKAADKADAILALLPARKAPRNAHQPGVAWWTPEAKDGEPIAHSLYRTIMGEPKTAKDHIAYVAGLHPDWDAKTYGHNFLGWHRGNLRKHGFEVPATIKPEPKPKAEKSPKAPKAPAAPTKAAKDMTPEERKAYIAKRNKDLKAKGQAPLAEDPTMPLPTLPKGTAHGRKFKK